MTRRLPDPCATSANSALPPTFRGQVLSLIPPMTQLNTPYPSTAYITGFLREQGVQAHQADLALALVLRLLSADGLSQVKTAALAVPPKQRSAQVQHFLAEFDGYHATIDRVIAFLQGRDSTLAHRIANRSLLPEGKWFATLDQHPDDDSGDPLGWAFGALGLHDRARHLATLYLNDLADVLKDAVDPRFEFVRYAEKLAAAQASFEPLAQALAAPPNLIDQLLIEESKKAFSLYFNGFSAIHSETPHPPTEPAPPRVVLLSVPFPGSVYAAFRIAQAIKATDPTIVTVLGGGYVNTELRELADPRVFDCFPGGFEQYPVLWVDRGGLRPADTEEFGVESGDIVDEPTPLGHRPTGHSGLRVVVVIGVPAPGRNGADQVFCSQQGGPQRVRRVDATGQSAGHPDHCDGRVRRRRHA